MTEEQIKEMLENIEILKRDFEETLRVWTEDLNRIHEVLTSELENTHYGDTEEPTEDD